MPAHPSVQTCSATTRSPWQGAPAVALPAGAGSFHDLAAEHWFPGVPRVYLPDAESAARALDEGQVAWAVLAVANAVLGPIQSHWALLGRHRLEVFDALWLPVAQAVLALPGTALADVRHVHSHPLALQQCRKTITEHAWTESLHADTAAAADWLARAQDREAAVIGPASLADRYGLTVLLPDASDHPGNQTRFFLLGGSRHRTTEGGTL